MFALANINLDSMVSKLEKQRVEIFMGASAP
jgi:hypothetical protein